MGARAWSQTRRVIFRQIDVQQDGPVDVHRHEQACQLSVAVSLGSMAIITPTGYIPASSRHVVLGGESYVRWAEGLQNALVVGVRPREHRD